MSTAESSTFCNPWRSGASYRFGCAGIISATLHGAAAVLLASMVVRVPVESPPIRVFLGTPAAVPAAIQDGAPTTAPALAAVAPQPQPAVQRANLARKPVTRIARRPVPPSTTAAPAVDLSAAAPESDVAGLGSAGSGGLANAGGVIGGDGAWSTAPHDDQPVLISKVLPQYPSAARLRGIEGQVVLQAVVAPDGRIEPDITVVQSVPQLDRAAIAALRQWRFRPARNRDGRPLRVTLQVPVRFVLR